MATIIDSIKKNFLGYTKRCQCCYDLSKNLKSCSYGRCEAKCCPSCLNQEGLCKFCDKTRHPKQSGGILLTYA